MNQDGKVRKSSGRKGRKESTLEGMEERRRRDGQVKKCN